MAIFTACYLKIIHITQGAETEGELSGRQQLLRVDLLNNLLLSLVRLLSWSPAVNLSRRQSASGCSKHLTHHWRTLKQHI